MSGGPNCFVPSVYVALAVYSRAEKHPWYRRWWRRVVRGFSYVG